MFEEGLPWCDFMLYFVTLCGIDFKLTTKVNKGSHKGTQRAFETDSKG